MDQKGKSPSSPLSADQYQKFAEALIQVEKRHLLKSTAEEEIPTIALSNLKKLKNKDASMIKIKIPESSINTSSDDMVPDASNVTAFPGNQRK